MEFSKESLSRFLIAHNLCSQRSAKNFLKNNCVCVNNVHVSDASFLTDSEKDEVSVNGKIIPSVKHICVMLNKPCGFVCSSVSDSHSTVYDLLKGKIDIPDVCDLKCVGRLDNDTSGLLLLSTNGSFVKSLTDPQNEIEKTYFVRLRDSVSDKDAYIKMAASGIEIPPEKKSPGFKSRPAVLKWLTDDSLEITVTEGKFHEVRRIFSALENHVVELKRIRIGNFVLDEKLKEGEFKVL